MSHRAHLLLALPLALGAPLLVAACSSSSSVPGDTKAGDAGSTGSSGDDAGPSMSADDATTGTAAGGDGAAPSGDGGSTTPIGSAPLPGDGGAPAGFWDPSNIPAAKNVMMFKFLN